MDLLNSFKPSMDRIYGDNAPELRQSFQTILVVLASVEKLDHLSTSKECEAKFDMLRGAISRHFDLQATLMFEAEYEGAQTHVDRHSTFEISLNDFCVKYSRNTVSQNTTAFRGIQKWLLHHLLMDDAHFAART